jgi:hypothetical protein
MGTARLLAKGWILFCVVAGGHALRFALASGLPLSSCVFAIGICVLLFMSMGLLFVGGYGVSGGLTHSGAPLLGRLKLRDFVPGFNESVFLLFVILSFCNQALVEQDSVPASAAGALQSAVYFAVPGQRALVWALESCTMDGGRIFASAFAWLLATIYLASAISRLRLQAGLIRLEQATRPGILGPAVRASLFAIVALVGIQFLFVGSALPWLGCSAFADITGALLTGLAPLMLAYLIVAAMASLLASTPEN